MHNRSQDRDMVQHQIEPQKTEGKRYIERWVFRVFPSAGRLTAEGFDLGVPEKEVTEGSVGLEVVEDERSVPKVSPSEVRGRGVKLVYCSKKWLVSEWLGGCPEIEDEEIMWKEFAAHKAKFLKFKREMTTEAPSPPQVRA